MMKKIGWRRLRLATQLLFWALLLLPLAGFPWFRGTYVSSRFLGLPLTDPFAAAQVLAAGGRWLAGAAAAPAPRRPARALLPGALPPLRPVRPGLPALGHPDRPVGARAQHGYALHRRPGDGLRPLRRAGARLRGGLPHPGAAPGTRGAGADGHRGHRRHAVPGPHGRHLPQLLQRLPPAGPGNRAGGRPPAGRGSSALHGVRTLRGALPGGARRHTRRTAEPLRLGGARPAGGGRPTEAAVHEGAGPGGDGTGGAETPTAKGCGRWARA